MSFVPRARMSGLSSTGAPGTGAAPAAGAAFSPPGYISASNAGLSLNVSISSALPSVALGGEPGGPCERSLLAGVGEPGVPGERSLLAGVGEPSSCHRVAASTASSPPAENPITPTRAGSTFRRLLRPARVAGPSLLHALDPLKRRLHAPEASARQHRRLRMRACLRLVHHWSRQLLRPHLSKHHKLHPQHQHHTKHRRTQFPHRSPRAQRPHPTTGNRQLATGTRQLTTDNCFYAVCLRACISIK